MSKLTKPQIRAHEQALRLLERGCLTHEEKLFVFENYREDAEHINSKAGAFFTPFGLANDFVLQIPYRYEHTIRIIDLCAGIGILSYAASLEGNSWSRSYADITCVEINPDYVEVGKKLLPQATWICGDALDPEFTKSLGRFDFAMSNPPFGNTPTPHRGAYISSAFEHMVIEAAARIADEGAFIIPQMSAPFVYSGTSDHRWLEAGKGRTFEEKTGIKLEFNAGIDTAVHKNEWHGVAPVCEIVCCDFTERTGQMKMEA
ncbi:methyltransferase [Clostridium sp. D33t1_170424_F3]|uniref:methyltransferase n=1 Tax=Clostridium sp. D33t1_170424_F3 TaxID=2787099 RepID=UPI0018ABC796|nr:methyltransferase [Clostridium sp. D33t1_170424_F3]